MKYLRMWQVVLVAVLSLTWCVHSTTSSIAEDADIFLNQMNEISREELAAAKRWQSALARKRELERDQKHYEMAENLDMAQVTLDERNLEDLLEKKRLNLEMEKRQSSKSCIQGDVIFILDSSGSIGISNWKLVLQFVNEAIKRMEVGPQATRVGLVTYGNKAHIVFNLNNFTSAPQMEPAVTSARFLDENTNTSGGIYVARAVMFTQANGDRPQAPNMAIVITDGESTYDHDRTIPYAQEGKAAGILFISIGVGDKTSKAELEGIASTGGDGKPLVFQVGSYDMLKNIQDTLATVACDPVATQAPPPCAADLPPVEIKDCPPRTCKNKCQYGFASDADHCLTCGCMPKPKQC